MNKDSNYFHKEPKSGSEIDYKKLQKEFDKIFGQDQTFFTPQKLRELARSGYDTKLVARGHMTGKEFFFFNFYNFSYHFL